MIENFLEKNNNTISCIKQAGEMFDALFLDQNKKNLVAELFKGIPGMIREQKVQETVNVAKGGIKNLKSTIV